MTQRPHPFPQSVVTAAPPPVPAAHTGPAWTTGLHLLLWVHTGSARVHQQDGPVHQLTAGEGVWIPADVGRRIETDAGSVAFPHGIVPDADLAAPAEPVRFAVPDEWRDRLILHFVHQVTPISSVGYDRTALLDVLGPARWAPDPPRYPALPAGTAARTVAEELVRNPALDHTVETWAGLVACSPSTLRREFVRDTGMPLARWRTRCRLAAACEFLATGYGVGQAAAHTGFASRNGFTRAFGECYGTTPRGYANRSRDRSAAQPARIAAAQHGRVLARLVSGDLPPVQRTLAATRTAPHTNDVHVLTWSYRGTGYLRIGDTVHERGRGAAVWIPAGVEHEAGTHQDSLTLPVGTLERGDADIPRPLTVQFPPAWDTYLLHRTVSDRSHLRPAGYDPCDILDVVDDRIGGHGSRGVPLPNDPRARSVAEDFLRRMSRSTAAPLDRTVQDAFRTETGMTVPAWENAARMRVARELLSHGVRPSRVARQVGYTRVSNFSRAFSRFHGVSPRGFQRCDHAPAGPS